MIVARQVPWWETRGFVAAILLVSIVPLLWPTIPPLVDLPGHMGRFRVQLDGGESEALRQFYRFEWQVVGNLGVDLLIIPFAAVFGLELGTKLIIMGIPALTMGSFIWIARELHGHIPPTAFFALPLAYGHPFLFGFANYTLSMALALCAFALWIRMGRLGAVALRRVIFVPISVIIWLAHAYGWGVLGLLAFAAELLRQRERNLPWFEAVARAGLECLVLALPMVLIIAWRSNTGGGMTIDWFRWPTKLLYLAMTLRDRWQVFDLACIALLTLVPMLSFWRQRFSVSATALAAAGLLTLAFVLLPRVLFGSAYADMRLTPFMFAMAILALRLRPEAGGRFAATVAIAGLIFLAVRMSVVTASLAMTWSQYSAALGALDHVPHGARLASFIGRPCIRRQWRFNDALHLPAMAIVRRHAFSNDQWVLPGAPLLTVVKHDADPFMHDPSQIVTQAPCPWEPWFPVAWALRALPRDAFDYVWLIDPPAFPPYLLRGMTPIWRNGRHGLYRIDDRRMFAQTPRP